MRSRKSPSEKLRYFPVTAPETWENFNLLWYIVQLFSVDVRYLFHYCKQDTQTLITAPVVDICCVGAGV